MQIHLGRENRNKNLIIHIVLSFFYKILAIGLNYMLIPLTFNYLDNERYGIWVTILSILSWMGFFDIGLGNGLRNKLSEALALNDIKTARIYISTTYAVVFFIAIILFAVFICILPFISFNKVFNTELIPNSEFLKVLIVVGGLFLLNFVFSLCNQVFYASQKASLPAINQLLSNLLAYITIKLLICFSSGSLLYVGICYGSSILLSNLILMCIFFKTYKFLRPSIKFLNFCVIKDVSFPGIGFFIIQMACLIIFTTDNIIITQLFGPEQVALYNIVFKLFSGITILHGLIIAPLWSGYTDAFVKRDFNWIKKTIKIMNLLMFPIILGTMIIIISVNEIIIIWFKSAINVPSSLAVMMGIYIIISTWNNIYAYFLNGIGLIKPQVYTAFVGGLINIPLSIYLALIIGVKGVILGTIVSLSFFAIIGPYQTYLLLKEKND